MELVAVDYRGNELDTWTEVRQWLVSGPTLTVWGANGTRVRVKLPAQVVGLYPRNANAAPANRPSPSPTAPHPGSRRREPGRATRGTARARGGRR